MKSKQQHTLSILVWVMSLAISGCRSAQISDPTATLTQGKPTAQSTSTPTYTTTPNPTATYTTTATTDLGEPLRIPQSGDNMTSWGWANSIQIWGTDFKPYDCHNTGVLDFICDVDIEPVSGLPYSKTSRSMHYWNENDPMTFEGQIPLEITPKTVTVHFREPVQNIAITSGPRDMVYIDSIVGITSDGTKIPMGFTLDENGILVPAPLFFDGYRSGARTYLQAERNQEAPLFVEW